jgi:hypothetical protein
MSQYDIAIAEARFHERSAEAALWGARKRVLILELARARHELDQAEAECHCDLGASTYDPDCWVADARDRLDLWADRLANHERLAPR